RARRAPPFLLRLLGPFFGGFGNSLANFLHDRVGVLPSGQHQLQFIPQPLAGRGEIKVVALDGETIRERDAPPRGMPGIGPVAGFEQDRMERSNLDNFAGDAIDFHPIARSEEHTSELQSQSNLVCRLLLEKKKKQKKNMKQSTQT